MQIRTSKTQEDAAAAARIDLRESGTSTRRQYISSVAERGGLILADQKGQVVGFCCLDSSYFFEKAFLSLLIVDQNHRRLGIGQKLVETVAADNAEIWTSTNRSNGKMRGLLDKLGWSCCGELEGLDPGDPEMFFKKAD